MAGLTAIWKEVEVTGPLGSTKTTMMVNSGATVCALPKEIIDKVGLYNERKGDLCGINSCASVRIGETDIKATGCPVRRVETHELDLPLLGMNYMSPLKATIDTTTGVVACKI